MPTRTLSLMGGGEARKVYYNKAGTITTFTNKAVPQPLTSEIKKSAGYHFFLFARCRDVNI